MMRTVILPLFILGFSASVPAGPFKPSVKQQIQLGQDAAKQLRKQEKVLSEKDPRSIFVRQVGARLVSTLKNKEPWSYTFEVIENKDVNAFALPGGPTFVYTGLLRHLRTADELAAVMGHEMTHVRSEHWARSYEQQQNRDLLLTVIATAIHANSMTANVLDLGKVIAGDLPYSRKVETEADDGGFRMMIDAKYNPQGMIDMFRVLEKEGGKSQKFLGMDLGDHPAVQRRIADISARLAKETMSFPPQEPVPAAVVERQRAADEEEKRKAEKGKGGSKGGG
ncbi:MAG: M48 family metalloprotease [Armatimonadetes bacterium]|nr:M48 family metalloprotease [Armatimonadota bacterium]